MPIGKKRFADPVSERKKSQIFEQAIFKEVDEQIADMEKEVEEYRQQSFAQAKEEILDQLFIDMQNNIQKIKLEAKQNITTSNLDSSRQLLQYRQSLADKVFQTVYDRIAEFTQSGAYESFLLEKLKKGASQHPYPHSILYVKPDDMKYSGKIKEIFGVECSVEQDTSIRLGGYKLFNEEKGIVLNEVLETILEDQREWFHMNSGLSLE